MLILKTFRIVSLACTVCRYATQ